MDGELMAMQVIPCARDDWYAVEQWLHEDGTVTVQAALRSPKTRIAALREVVFYRVERQPQALASALAAGVCAALSVAHHIPYPIWDDDAHSVDENAAYQRGFYDNLLPF